MRNILCLLLLSSFLIVQGQSLPADFFDQLVDANWPFLMGYTFDEAGNGYGWTKEGKVYRTEDGTRPEEPWLDISEEVGDFGDHGLLGFALHPNFQANGYVYLLYVVDRHHLQFFGTASYDPQANDFQAPTIGRVTRYQADVATEFKTFVPNSRKILLGTEAADGFPILHLSHGVGNIVFAQDGSMLVSCGDGGSYIGTDAGGDESGSQASQAIAEGIIQPYEDVGAFRSQLVSSLNGKILRLDPETGDGLPSNPFYQLGQPRAAASRVWALGFRNPCRFSLVPGSGGHAISEGLPGDLLVGDVGWANWEEFNRVTEGGQNFGWPLYEGIQNRWQYFFLPMENGTAPNPLAGSGGCEKANFTYQELILDATTDPDPLFVNPCAPSSEIPSNIPTFVHQPPIVTYSNADWNLEEQGTFVPVYDGEGKLTRIDITDLNSPVVSDFFNGVCALGGLFYDADGYPDEYKGRYFAADLRGWIRQFEFDETTGELGRVRPFFQGTTRILQPALNPADGCIWYVSYDGVFSQLRKICFGGNPPPTAKLTVDQMYGPGPLTVSLSAAESSDPQNQALSFSWDLGDGNTAEGETVTHTFEASSAEPTFYTVVLTATDEEGATHTAEQIISLNNTPPQVDISSIPEGTMYSLSGIREFELRADVTDAEHSEEELSYAWFIALYHNTHNHPEPLITSSESEFLAFPEGCGEEEFWYRVALTVRDAAGLEGTDERLIYPYCETPYHSFLSLTALYDEAGVALNWEMENEPADTRYLVQKSSDRVHFETVGEVVGDNSASYSFLDPEVDFETGYYRIEAVPNAPVVEFSEIVEMGFRDKGDIWVFPNPTTEVLFVELANPGPNTEFEILDLHGRLLIEGSWDNIEEQSVYEISVRALQSGIYLYRISDGLSTQSGKFMKQ